MPDKILVMIPAYNEEQSLAALIAEIRSVAPFVDILVINDHSRDQTEAEALRAGADVVTLPFNLGIGGAVQTGYKIAAEQLYDIAVQLDGDGQHDPRYLAELIRPIQTNQSDFCIGSRFLVTDDSFKSTPWRRFGINFFRHLLKGMTGLSLTDPTSGFRACRLSLVRRFAEYYPVDFPEPEAIKIARRYGFRIQEIPVRMRARQGGESSIRYLSTLYYMLKVTFAILIDTLKRTTKETNRAD